EGPRSTRWMAKPWPSTTTGTGTGCRGRRSGSTPAGPGPPGRGTHRSTRSPGTPTTPVTGSGRSAARRPTPGVCTTCSATCGSGASSATTPRSTASTGCCAAAAGATGSGAVAPVCGGAATRPSRSRTSASGWRARCHDAAGLRWATRTAVPLPAAVGDVDQAVTGCGGGGGRAPLPAAVGDVDDDVAAHAVGHLVMAEQADAGVPGALRRTDRGDVPRLDVQQHPLQAGNGPAEGGQCPQRLGRVAPAARRGRDRVPRAAPAVGELP